MMRIHFEKRESSTKTFQRGLVLGVFFNSKIFGLRGLTEHKQLQTQQFTIYPEKIMFNEFISKTVKGDLNDKKFIPKTINAIKHSRKPSVCC
jgi:hypothetical protein